jgi:hypothetical protein
MIDARRYFKYTILYLHCTISTLGLFPLSIQKCMRVVHSIHTTTEK